MRARPGIIGAGVALQILLRPKHVVIGSKILRGLGGDAGVGREGGQPAGDGRGHGPGDFELHVEQVLELRRS